MTFKRKPNLLIAIITTVVFVVLIVTIWQNNKHRSAVNNPASPTPTPIVVAKPGTAGNVADENKEAAKNAANSATTPLPSAQPSPQTISLFLVRAEQPAKGQPIQVRADIAGTTTGTCVANFTSQSAVLTRTSPISYDGRNSSCGSFDIPASDFPYDSVWTMNLSATSSSQTSNAATKNVTVSK